MPTTPTEETASMFHVKICGLTTAEDARAAGLAGADAVGLNFVAGSPRRITEERGREIVAALPPGILRVGVFAGTSVATIRHMVKAVGLDCVQLHGHLAPHPTGSPNWAWDPPEHCLALDPIPVIRAVRLRDDGPAEGALGPARDWIAAAGAAGRRPAMLLVDAGGTPGGVSQTAAGSLGGTGRVVDWQRLVAAGDPGIPLALAGGLTAENVARAIHATGVRGVDTASGVESALGWKDWHRMEAFVAAAAAAFATG
jgi:phosphoribosylanthranilate isomerase